MWGGDGSSEKTRSLSRSARTSYIRKQKDQEFPIEVYEKLLKSTSKTYGVTIKTMTKVA